VGISLSLLALLATAPLEHELPLQVTPIADLSAVADMRHDEVLQVVRDFGRPEVNIALDAWRPTDDDARIDAVRVWWSDAVDRFPFNDRVLRHLVIDYRRIRADRWRIRVEGDKKRFVFDVALHDGEPAVFADVALGDGTIVRQCRADSAQLLAQRFLGIPIGIDRMQVECTDARGVAHVGALRMHALGKRRR
jgi:hypothetical protein